jgi:hypothetical protein
MKAPRERNLVRGLGLGSSLHREQQEPEQRAPEAEEDDHQEAFSFSHAIPF